MAFIVRPTTSADMASVDAVLAASYPKLLAADYPPSILVTAVPLIAKARPELVISGTYFLAEEDGVVIGVGGWTRKGPMREAMSGVAHIRHFGTHPTATRRGVGRAILSRAVAEAEAAGMSALSCFSTRTAVPFYAASGFDVIGERDIQLRAGIVFPSVEMALSLPI